VTRVSAFDLLSKAIEGIESVRSVFKAITATRNAARPIQFSQRKPYRKLQWARSD
jgi:hypothetical protein